MDLRKAAEMALEALELGDDISAEQMSDALDALRQALAKPEQESVICRNIYEVWAGSEGILKPLTSKEAYLLGLVEQMRDEAKKGLKPLYTAPVDAVNISQERVDETAKNRHEPWKSVQCTCGGTIYFKHTKREWVGLTDEELKPLCHEWQIIYGGYVRPFAETIEAKLKEKNT